MDWSEAVRLAREGKDEGFNFLYEQTYQKSYYVALKYMKQEELAVDVVQEAYIKAFSSLEQLQDAEKFTRWLSRIVATKALDELRKKKMLLFSQLQTDNEEISMEELLADERIDTRPELALDQEETCRLVQEIIDTLSNEQRICVMMFYIEHLSVRNIAQMLGVSENTVKSRLKYGRKNIEAKVLELEKKGTKLYGIAPFTFFLYLLLQDSMSVQAAQMSLSSILKAKTISVKAGKGITSKATAITIRRSIIGIVAGLAVCGGAAVIIHSMTEDSGDVQEMVNEVPLPEAQEVQLDAAWQEEVRQEAVQEVEEDSQTEKTEEETQEAEISQTETQEVELTNDRWQEAYSDFADSLQADGNGYALLEVAGCDVPILIVMPAVFSQTVDLTGLPAAREDFESEEAYRNFIKAFSPMQMVTEDSCIYTNNYWQQLYFYDTETDEVIQIINAESNSAGGALIDGYIEAGFYLTYLPGEKLLAGDLVGSSVVIETYSFDAETGNLLGADTYADESAGTVDRKDIIYYRLVEQAVENIGAVQE